MISPWSRVIPYHMLFPQAAEQVENLKEQRRREERENLVEISHIMTSDMMIERADVARVHMGKGRPPQILPDGWKGMTAEQLRTIYRDQEQQRCEKQVQESPIWHIVDLFIVHRFVSLFCHIWRRPLHSICRQQRLTIHSLH